MAVGSGAIVLGKCKYNLWAAVGKRVPFGERVRLAICVFLLYMVGNCGNAKCVWASDLSLF